MKLELEVKAEEWGKVLQALQMGIELARSLRGLEDISEGAENVLDHLIRSSMEADPEYFTDKTPQMSEKFKEVVASYLRVLTGCGPVGGRLLREQETGGSIPSTPT